MSLKLAPNPVSPFYEGIKPPDAVRHCVWYGDKYTWLFTVPHLQNLYPSALSPYQPALLPAAFDSDGVGEVHWGNG